MFYKKLQKKICEFATANDWMEEYCNVTCKALSVEEAIGKPDRNDFPIQTGTEVLMEANFQGFKGQAFTDNPCTYNGILKDVLTCKLENTETLPLFIAVLNACVKVLNPELKTRHCIDDGMNICAGKIVDTAINQSVKKVGIIGLQPAILEELVKKRGSKNVRCLDRSRETVEMNKSGVMIEYGNNDSVQSLFQWSDLVLSTGSTIANGSLPDIINASEKSDKPVIFYGTTVAGSAHLMELEHLCFQSF